MYTRIIVGYDGSAHAEDALALGHLLAKTTGAELVVAGVFPELAPVRASAGDVEVEHADLVERAARSVGAEAEAVPSSSPARGLHELAEEIDADLLVVGSYGKATLGRVLAGSVAQRLLQGSPCAVAVAPAGYRNTEPGLRVLAVGYDGLPEAKEALAAAVEIAEAAGATLRIYAVVEPPSSWVTGYATSDYAASMREYLREQVDNALELVPEPLRPADELLKGEPATALREEAEKGVDLLCVGSRGYGPVRRVLLGSVSAELVQSAPCPVLVVPRGAGDEAKERQEAVAGERAR